MALASSRTTRTVLLAALLTLAALGGAVLHRPPSLAGDLLLPWWVFVGLFCLTEAFVLRLRVRGQLEGVSVSEVPLVIGLFAAAPAHVVIARMLAGSLVFLLFQRHTPVKAILNTALVGASSAAAIGVFGLLVGRHQAIGPVGWLAAPVAISAGGLLEGAVLVLVISWYGGPRPAREVLRELAFSIIVPVIVSILGLGTIYALTNGAAAVPLVMTGAAALMGYRAFAALSDRHASLERIYLLSDALALAQSRDDVLASLLAQSGDLMRAEYSEVTLTGLRGSGPIRWSMRHGSALHGPEDAGPPLEPDAEVTRVQVLTGATASEQEFLAAREVSGALVVPLRVDAEVAGHLLVGDRRGEERPFALSDARLLETVANHAVVALRNGQLIERLNQEARRDELTGLPNRLDLREQLDELAEAAASGGPAVSVMVLDFNGFKAINDTLGHQAGDELLRVLAGRLSARAGRQAVIARMGGDEFAVLSTACAQPWSATDLAARLLEVFNEPVAVAGARLRLSSSVGIALGPRDGATGSDLLCNADIAMYAAKTGSGGARMFSPDMVEVTAAALTLASDLRDAVSQSGIGVVVQPIVHLGTRRVHSVEVLARWTHPQLGEIAPEAFFAAAERSGQVAALSVQVLDQALSWSARWLQSGRPVRVAVNLAPRWLADSSLPEQIEQALTRHAVPAELLCLEITENSVIADPRRAIETLERLRAMGVHLSVDDFGTGYSSLTYLSRLPVDQLKIDKSFITQLLDSRRDTSIVRSIIDLGRNLGLEVVAEGVTDSGTLRSLEDLDCGLGQGYLFSRPMPCEDLADLLDRWGVVPASSSDGVLDPDDSGDLDDPDQADHAHRTVGEADQGAGPAPQEPGSRRPPVPRDGGSLPSVPRRATRP